jgi:hypothetical protein
MANILLTTKCNRSCPYCFAENEMADSSGERLAWENLVYVADFLLANGQRNVSLLGGEPTLHPQCVDFIRYLLDRGFGVTVFSNGILSPARLGEFQRYLAAAPIDRLNIVCNLNDPLHTHPPAHETERLADFLSAMGPWTTAGFNIYRLDFDLDFIFDQIARYGMKRHLRIGITHPIPGQGNSFIKPQDIRTVVARLFSFRPLFDAYRIRPGVDCGFPLCAFTDEELGWLHRFPGISRFSCSPALDISPDMSVYHCFPLSNYKRRSLFEFDSLAEINAHFVRLRDEIRCEVAGIYEQCDGCRHQEDGVCAGGGLCQILGRFIAEAPIRLPGIVNEISKYRLPAP